MFGIRCNMDTLIEICALGSYFGEKLLGRGRLVFSMRVQYIVFPIPSLSPVNAGAEECSAVDSIRFFFYFLIYFLENRRHCHLSTANIVACLYFFLVNCIESKNQFRKWSWITEKRPPHTLIYHNKVPDIHCTVQVHSYWYCIWVL